MQSQVHNRKKLIEWQTGKLFAYLKLHNSRINVKFRNCYQAGPPCPNIVRENNTAVKQLLDVSSTHIRFVGDDDFRLVQYQLLMKDTSEMKLEKVR